MNALSGGDSRVNDSSSADLEGFFLQVQGRAVTMAAMAVGDRETALDLVQDTMVRLLGSYRQYQPDAWPPLFWKILQNVIRDTYRRRRVRQRIMAFFPARDGEEDPDPLAGLADEHSPQPDGALSDARFSADLQRALQALPLRQQQAFLLRHWEGLDTSETAAALGISEGSVKTHLSRAMAVLRERLEAHQ